MEYGKVIHRVAGEGGKGAWDCDNREGLVQGVTAFGVEGGVLTRWNEGLVS